jgi:hypothetical protein
MSAASFPFAIASLLMLLSLIVSLQQNLFVTGETNLYEEHFGSSYESMGRVLKHCTQSCKGGACRYENCKNALECAGGACYFKNCDGPACKGGGCIFANTTKATCDGGGCLFLSPKDTLKAGYCKGEGCFLERVPYPRFENYISM